MDPLVYASRNCFGYLKFFQNLKVAKKFWRCSNIHQRSDEVHDENGPVHTKRLRLGRGVRSHIRKKKKS